MFALNTPFNAASMPLSPGGGVAERAGGQIVAALPATTPQNAVMAVWIVFAAELALEIPVNAARIALNAPV